MNPYILPLADPEADLLTVGGKGISLAKLANAGLAVPGGFHITTAAYRHFVQHNNLQPGIAAALQTIDILQPTTLEAASTTICRLFAQAEIPDDLAQAIMTAYTRIFELNTAVAVRSSATAEDLPEASFAGQQETYLNVIGTDQLLQATQKCWASLWTARAIGYRARQGITADGVALAVVVQVLVQADAAGILFTANPLNGQRDEVVISAAWGLGEAVVGGIVTPDTIIVNKVSDTIIKRETADKLIMTVRTETGTEERVTPTQLRQKPVLSDEQSLELAGYGVQIEELYGMPMDIEWTLAEGQFAIVQARPVTALPEVPIEWAPPNPKGTYMRTSVADLMPEPLRPLFLTLGIPAQVAQMQPLGQRLLGSEPVLAPDYFTHINTYAYMNAAFPARAWWWVLTGLLPAYPGLFRRLVPLWREELHPEYQTFVASKQDMVPTQTSADALWHETQALVDAAAYYICGLMFATMGASAGSEGLLTRVYDKMVKRDGDPEATTLLMGWDNIPVRSEKSLYDLALWSGEDEALTTYILNTSAQELAVQMKTPDFAPLPLFPEFVSRFQAHLENFGHIIFQLDFTEPLPRDHPEMMLENIKMYLRGEGSNPYQRQQASEQKRIQTAEIMLNRLRGLKLWIFRKALNWGQSMAEVREDALSEIGLAYPKIRDFLGELGHRFVTAGIIEQGDDIFWLEKDEISICIANLQGKQVVDNLAGRVAERKAFNQRVKQITPPPMMPMKKRVMGIKTEVFIAHGEEKQTGNILKGVATSAGKVTAPACVLHGPEDFDQMRHGDILVAGTTTPAWTPLFTMASAVVTDIGGPLSHGSIVAREYGIPAVMGTGLATRRIQNGQIITVDGREGIVYLDDKPEAILPTEWRLPDPKAHYARGSLAEHTPSPVSPLFATLGLRLANEATNRLWRDFMDVDPTIMFVGDSFYMPINSYIYGGFRFSWKAIWIMLKVSFTQLGSMMRGTVARWQEAHEVLVDTVAAWEKEEIVTFSPTELLESVRTVFAAAVKYYTVIQSTLPAASMSEVFFSRFYNGFVKRKSDPEFTTLLFGFETMPMRAEKSLFDIAAWLKEQPVLAAYTLQTATETLVADYKRETPPTDIPTELWVQWQAQLHEHFDTFGRTAYEFDFVNPTPAEAPSPQFEAIKLFLEGKAASPYVRQEMAVTQREQATQSILNRIGWPRKKWFTKLLKWAQETGAIREDSIADMGTGHPLIRRLFAELGNRFVAGGAIKDADDIYWLEEHEVEELVAALEKEQSLPSFVQNIPIRKAEWRAALQLTPPVALPQKSFILKLISGSEAKEKDGKLVLKGLGTGTGQVKAPACVLHGPEDFPKMKPGEVLVATTTTPAWTPLFAMAAAVVTDIGGPLSHSSIVAREYGIPAVMAARNATRHIHSGQMIVVDGTAGTVTLESNGRA